jgi:hypothetical protein
MTVPPSSAAALSMTAGGVLADLGDEDGVPGLDLPADRGQRDVLVIGAIRRCNAADEHAGGRAQQHAQRAAEHPDQQADQATARHGEPGGGVGAFGHPHDAVGSPLQ